jgi:hypothetical protein
MLSGEIRNQIDAIWNTFWTGGISNPLEVIEQITYLLFLRRLDELQQLEESKANRLRKSIEKRFFPDGQMTGDSRTTKCAGPAFGTRNPAACTRSSPTTSSLSSANWVATALPTRTT